MIRFCENIKHNYDTKKAERESAVKRNLPIFDGKCSFRVLEDLIKSLDEKYERTPNKHSTKANRIIFFGTGDISNVCERLTKNTKKDQILAYVDTDPSKQGKLFNNLPIISPNDIVKFDYDYIVIASDRYYVEILNQLIKKCNILQNKILRYDEYIISKKFDF